MRLNVLFPLLLTPVVLASCQAPRPTMIGSAVFGNPPYAQEFIFKGSYAAITFETEPAAETVQAQVSKVQFIIGTKIFTAKSHTYRPNSYIWMTTKPCQDLPQGDKLPLRGCLRPLSKEFC